MKNGFFFASKLVSNKFTLSVFFSIIVNNKLITVGNGVFLVCIYRTNFGNFASSSKILNASISFICVMEMVLISFFLPPSVLVFTKIVLNIAGTGIPVKLTTIAAITLIKLRYITEKKYTCY